MPNILALIPAYNERAHIQTVVSAACAHAPTLVVDDGSGDDTAALAAQAGATVIRQSPNQGKGAALHAGFAWGLEHGYEAVLTLDADGQHDPAEIPAFVQAFEQHAGDLIIGRRTFTQMPPIREWANATGSRLLSWALGQPILDNQSGYRLHSRALLATVKLTTTRFDAEVEMLVQAVAHGLQLGWVPIRTIYADEVSHINPLLDTARFLRVVWWAWRTRRSTLAPR
jgi:glycosyltransferase involved in cell wall biosynthesis